MKTIENHEITTIKYINCAGIGFVSNAKCEKGEICEMRLILDSPQTLFDLNFKIRIIGIETEDDENYCYKGIYRDLSRVQLCVILSHMRFQNPLLFPLLLFIIICFQKIQSISLTLL